MGIIPCRSGNVILPVVGFPLHYRYTYYMVFCFFFIFLGNYRWFPKKSFFIVAWSEDIFYSLGITSHFICNLINRPSGLGKGKDFSYVHS